MEPNAPYGGADEGDVGCEVMMVSWGGCDDEEGGMKMKMRWRGDEERMVGATAAATALVVAGIPPVTTPKKFSVCVVPHASRLRIGKSNFRLRSDLKSKESTLQVVYNDLKLTPFYKAFLVTADVPKIYMQEFWATATVHHHSIRFKMNNKKRIVNLEELGHSGEIKMITDVNIKKLHQPWRSLVAIINKCLSGKSTGHDSLRLSQAQILWGMYHKKNVDFAYLLWEGFVYQVEHKDAKKSNEMYYPRFTKVIVNFFMTKDQSIVRRNKVNWHYARDDHMFTTIKLVSRNQSTQQYGVIFPVELSNKAIRNSKSYKEYYAIASGVEPLKKTTSFRKKQSSSDTTVPPPTKGKRLKISTKVDKLAKEKQPAKSSTAKGLTVLFEVALIKAKQIKLATKRRLTQTHIFHASRSGVDEGTGTIPGVPVVPNYESNDKEISWKSSEEDDENNDEEKIIRTPSHDDKTDDEDNNEDSDGMNVEGDEGANEEDDADELYRDVNINLKGRDIQMADVQTTQVIEDTHVSLTSVNPEDVSVTTAAEPPLLSATTLPPLTISIIPHVQQTPAPSPANVPISSLQDLPNFGSLFRWSNKSMHISDEKMNLYKAVVDAYKCDNLILNTYEDTVTLKRRQDNEDKDEEPSAGLNWGSKRRREGKEPESTKEPMHSTHDLEELAHQEFKIGETDDQPIEEASQHPHYNLEKKADSRTSFNELMDTPIDFSAFMMNQLKVDTLNPKLLAGPTYKLMKGSCKSLVELEFFLEEVYKATTDQLDWNNPKGQQYLYDLLKPLPLIPNSRGRRVIPFDHFINNDLEYLRGGASSRKYLQFGVKSYQKKLNLIKPDTYRSDLKCKEAYTAYSNPRGFIYQNKDKHNRLMCIDELHKFSDGTLNDVRTALDDRLKGSRMQYLPQTIWRRSDKHRAVAMIQAIDKQLKTRKIMRSLEKFVGGILYEDYDGIPKRPTMYLNLWSNKAVRHRYSNPMIQPEPEGSTQGYPLVSVEVLRKIHTLAGNPVKEILLKLNLPDHRILKDRGGDTSAEGGKDYKMVKRDYALLMTSRCSSSHSIQAKEQAQNQKSMITTTNSKVKDWELKTKSIVC
nr:hypothetical protein [Tanacetum cinerariifolium]